MKVISLNSEEWYLLIIKCLKLIKRWIINYKCFLIAFYQEKIKKKKTKMLFTAKLLKNFHVNTLCQKLYPRIFKVISVITYYYCIVILKSVYKIFLIPMK